MTTTGNDGLVDNWGIADLSERIDRGNPGDLAFVASVLAARINARDQQVTDARALLVDVSQTLELLGSAIGKVFRTAAHELEDDQGNEILAVALSQMDDAANGLRLIAEGWI